MGAWGYGIYSNDSALDTRDELAEVSDEQLRSLKLPAYLLKGNSCIFVIADTQIKRLKKITSKCYDLFKEAYDNEVETILSWSDPALRMKHLIEFKTRVEKYYNSSVCKPYSNPQDDKTTQGTHSIQQLEKALRELNIDLYDEDRNVRDYFDVTREFYQMWIKCTEGVE